jgi:hypothetical protein
MIQSGGALRFGAKPRQSPRVVRQVFWKEFHGHEPVKTRVFGLLDNAHPSTAEFLKNAVVGNSFSDHRIEIV